MIPALLWRKLQLKSVDGATTIVAKTADTPQGTGKIRLINFQKRTVIICR